jgi:hypothetical protein
MAWLRFEETTPHGLPAPDAARAAPLLRRGAQLSRGPSCECHIWVSALRSSTPGSALCAARVRAPSAAPRPGHDTAVSSNGVGQRPVAPVISPVLTGVTGAKGVEATVFRQWLLVQSQGVPCFSGPVRRVVAVRAATFATITRTAGNELAIPAGFEPATHGVEIRYSIQLSYGTAVSGNPAFIALPI